MPYGHADPVGAHGEENHRARNCKHARADADQVRIDALGRDSRRGDDRLGDHRCKAPRHPRSGEKQDRRRREKRCAGCRVEQVELDEREIGGNRHGGKDRHGHREPRQRVHERPLCVAQLRNAVDDAQQQREQGEEQGQTDPLPGRLTGDRHAQEGRHRLDPAVRDHPAAADHGEIVQILERDLAHVRQVTHALVEFARPGHRLRAEQKLAAARPALSADQSDLGVRNHPARRSLCGRELDLDQVRNLVERRKRDPVQGLVQRHGRAASRLRPLGGGHAAQVQALVGCFGQRDQVIEARARRRWQVVAGNVGRNGIAGAEKRHERSAGTRSVGRLERIDLVLAKRARAKQGERQRRCEPAKHACEWPAAASNGHARTYG
ncbi:MAG: hypothetical protein IPM22_10465 [Betaproteobacteria bacterium]|nr:hypothetical protein [Betaproteobacteria bacterium]